MMGRPTAKGALARTLLLMRDHLPAKVSDTTLVDALADTRVALVADRVSLASAAGQHAFITTALQIARSGGRLHLECPDVRLIGVHAPLRGEYLEPALGEVLKDLVPGAEATFGQSGDHTDLAVIVGDARWRGRAGRTLWLTGDDWACRLSSRGAGEPWRTDAPFGALGAAGLAAAEAFKLAMIRLDDAALDADEYRLFFAPTAEALVRLAPTGTPIPTPDLGRFDCISGGAIAQATLFALIRILGAQGHARIIEPQRSDLTNLNRYAFLLRSHVGRHKTANLASHALGEIGVTLLDRLYDTALAEELGPFPDAVLVGVDDIPSRWRVQATQPHWLGVGATTHYSALVSYHTPRLPCARCLHPTDDPGNGPIPTVSFVTHWAGLWLASLFVRARMGMSLSRREQSAFLAPLRMDSTEAVWLSPVRHRVGCPLRCAA